MRFSDIFSERLKTRRIERGFKTQKDFARATGISIQAINFYESGARKPEFVQLWKIADALNCSVDWLMGRSDNLGETPTTNDWILNRFMKAE